jgi:hypothetical protein
MIDRRWRFKRYPQAAILALLAGWAFAVAVGSDQPADTGLLGGDYPAFYVAGSIVNEGLADRLYDFELQASMQTDLVPDGFLPFAYPPFAAAAYAPLALLPYRTSYALFTIISFSALALTIWILRPITLLARDYPWIALAGAALFYPMLRAIIGGQNTAISLLIVVGTWRLIRADRDLAAGIALSLLAFKPQFLLPILGVVWLARKYRAVYGCLAGMGVLYFVGVALTGWSWPIDWWSEATSFALANDAVNGLNFVTWHQLALWLGVEPAWIALSSATAGWIAWTAYRHGRSDLSGVLAMTLPGAVLLAPHALFYDVGLALPSLFILADRRDGRFAAVLWISGLTHLLGSALGFNPLIFLLLLMVVAARRSIRSCAVSSARKEVL